MLRLIAPALACAVLASAPAASGATATASADGDCNASTGAADQRQLVMSDRTPAPGQAITFTLPTDPQYVTPGSVSFTLRNPDESETQLPPDTDSDGRRVTYTFQTAGYPYNMLATWEVKACADPVQYSTVSGGTGYFSVEQPEAPAPPPPKPPADDSEDFDMPASRMAELAHEAGMLVPARVPRGCRRGTFSKPARLNWAPYGVKDPVGIELRYRCFVVWSGKASLRSVRAIFVSRMKDILRQSGSSGSVRAFRAGRYSGSVITYRTDANNGRSFYVWRARSRTYVLNVTLGRGGPSPRSVRPGPLISSFA